MNPLSGTFRCVLKNAAAKTAGIRQIVQALSPEIEPQPGSPAKPSRWQLLRRLICLGLEYRGPCAAMLLLDLVLVTLAISSLGMTGVGIDYIRHQVDPSSPPPEFPFGWIPPVEWSPFQVVCLIAGIVLACALLGAVLRYTAALASSALSQEVLIRIRTDVYLDSASFLRWSVKSLGFPSWSSGDAGFDVVDVDAQLLILLDSGFSV